MDGGIHLSRTGVVKSKNGYYILRRNVIANCLKIQYFTIKKISENTPYFFWQNWYDFKNAEQITNIWIYVDTKYFTFFLNSKLAKYNGIVQESRRYYSTSDFENKTLKVT